MQKLKLTPSDPQIHMAYIDKIGKARVHDFFCDDTRQSLVVVGNIVNSVCFNTILCRSVVLVVVRRMRLETVEGIDARNSSV